ncbi:hypothetical protein [Pseudomonas sp. WS 5011]|uniref:hypothetical protein n=1 Tax=Pseudomonas sp. WS 5011 TaxID=2717477 RepID=UPI00147418C9|nr:hypothetical protein [Pseudomonas sp. WS 5011]NMY53294.1 hypothetical protein [Pseudomonas sp. WS 5011]
MSEVIYVAGMAAMLGKTESSIREGLRRRVPWLPASFKIAGQHAWIKSDVMTFIRGLSVTEAVPPAATPKAKPGRKRRIPPVYYA